MTLEYISLEEAKDLCGVQHAAHDDLIESLIEAGSSIVKNYMGNFSVYQAERNADDDYIVDSNYEPVINPDSTGDLVVKAEIKLAVKLLVEGYYRRDPLFLGSMSNGRLPPHIETILYPLRDPALK